jgi:hypothetical protein
VRDDGFWIRPLGMEAPVTDCNRSPRRLGWYGNTGGHLNPALKSTNTI